MLQTTKPSSPPLTHSPSDIRRFLNYAEERLGVEGASNYAIPLQLKRYGPDILPDVALSDLTAADVGIPPGDALRLKRGSSDWWNHMAKRQREAEKSTGQSGPDATNSWDSPQPAKRHHSGSGINAEEPVRYEMRWPDGGGQRFYGPRMVRGNRSAHEDLVWYFCEARNDWYPIPPGFVAPHPSGQIDDDPFA